MDVRSYRTSRRRHVACISGVVCKTAERICERSRYVEVIEAERCSESSVKLRSRIVAEIFGSFRIFRCHCSSDDLTVRIKNVLVPHRKTVGLVHACVLRHEEGVQRKSLGNELVAGSISQIAVDLTVLVGIREHDDLVGVVREVQISVPTEVLSVHQGSVNCELDTLVPHVTDIVIVSAETV